MATRNLTLSLPEDLIRSAKVYAAGHDTSINNLVKALLEEKLARESRALDAADRLLALAEQGPWFDTDPGTIKRDDIYERR